MITQDSYNQKDFQSFMKISTIFKNLDLLELAKFILENSIGLSRILDMQHSINKAVSSLDQAIGEHEAKTLIFDKKSKMVLGVRIYD